MTGLAYTDPKGRIYFDAERAPLADGGIIRPPDDDELIPVPRGAVTSLLPGRRPLVRGGNAMRKRTALAVLLPAGFTRLLVPAYITDPGSPTLPLFGYAFACERDDELVVAAARTDESDDWQPRYFAPGELEGKIAARVAVDPSNNVLRQVGLCSTDYGCFTAQNVFLERGEAALPVSPKCNARCVGCISEQAPETGFVAPQERIAYEPDVDELARVALHHLERADDGIVSFGQGCEGEPLLRSTTIAKAIQTIRAARPNGTININTNGSMTQGLARLIDAGLDAVRISLNSFRPAEYEAYYRPVGYDLHDVFASIRLAHRSGLRVSLNVLTHPGVTDNIEEIAAMDAFLEETPIAMIQTRTLNIDPELYFARVGRPENAIGMRAALARIRDRGVAVGNFTHTH